MFQRKGVKTTFRLLMLLGSCVKTSFDIVSTIVLPWLLVGEKHFHKILCQTLLHWLPPILRVWRKLLYQKLVKFQLNFIWACGYNYGLSGLLNSWTNCNSTRVFWASRQMKIGFWNPTDGVVSASSLVLQMKCSTAVECKSAICWIT